jgi:hypothetical protein
MAHRRWRIAGAWTVRLVELAAGTWVASVLVVGLTLAPWPVVVLVAAAFLASFTLVTRALRLDRVTRALVERLAGLDGPQWQHNVVFAVWIAWCAVLPAVRGALRVGLLWLVVQALGAIGLASRLEGLWPTVVATVVMFGGANVVGWLRRMALALLVRGRRAQLSWAAAELPLTAVALGGGVLLLPGVELGGGLGLGAQLLAVGVLAWAIASVRLEFAVPFLVLASTFAVNWLKAWLVGLLGVLLTVPLRIDGLLSHVVLALLITALAWPAVRVRRRAEARREAMAAMERHQQMTMGMHHAEQSMFGIR